MNKKIKKRKTLSDKKIMAVAGGQGNKSRFDIPSPKVQKLNKTPNDDFFSFNYTLQDIVERTRNKE